MRIGGIEAGGTKMVCAFGDEQGHVLDRVSIPTTTAEETLGLMMDYFRVNPVDALGVASFGPIDLREDSAGYGQLKRTPKPGWGGVNMVRPFAEALQIPVQADTDVNGAVLAEVLYGAARGADSAIYVTIGTGIGVGVYVNDGLLHGAMHPEGGHIALKRHPSDGYAGHCPFHRDCFEGLASGPAIEARWGKPPTELADRDEVWELEAYYIAQAVASYLYVYSAQKVILGGGVMHQKDLLRRIRSELFRQINGYLEFSEDCVVQPELGDNAGIVGAIELGLRALRQRR